MIICWCIFKKAKNIFSKFDVNTLKDMNFINKGWIKRVRTLMYRGILMSILVRIETHLKNKRTYVCVLYLSVTYFSYINWVKKLKATGDYTA